MLDKTLEIARGLAAVSVFLFHIRPMVAQGAPWLDDIAASGSNGVTLFFVISGYCMFAAASSTRTHGKTIWNFFKRRLRRIYPPLWASVLAVVTLPYLLEGLSSLKTGVFLAPAQTWAAFSVADWGLLLTLTRVFLAPPGDLQSVFTPVNSVYWTLAIEVQFYMVVAFALAFGRYWKETLIAVTALSLVPYIGQNAASGLFIPFWPSFAVGLALRWMHESGLHVGRIGHTRPMSIGIAGLGITLLLAAHVDLHAQIVFALVCAALLFFAGDFEPAITGLLSRQTMAGKLASLPLRFALMTGASSYSLYLLHAKLYQLPAMLSRQLFSQASLINLIFVVGMTIVFCYGFYITFEKPFMSKSYRHRVQD